MPRTDSIFKETQNIVGEWADFTFPLATPQTITRHMMEELTEIEDALLGVALHTPEDVPEEAADLFLLLLHLSHKLGFDLWEEGRKKLLVNRERFWEAPNTAEAAERGYWKHEEVKEVPVAQTPFAGRADIESVRVVDGVLGPVYVPKYRQVEKGGDDDDVQRKSVEVES
jgi:NTP pyrophosphatase (non-canonical NTP hydrolase)